VSFVILVTGILLKILVYHTHVLMDTMEDGKPKNVYLVTNNIVPDVLILTLV